MNTPQTWLKPDPADSASGVVVIGAVRAVLGSLMAVLMTIGSWAQADFLDPMQHPAELGEDPQRKPLMTIVDTGEQIVTAGLRGVIATSADGRRWSQAVTPVQSDLVALSFPSARKGWAVGHDGVVLQSTDGGHHWVRHLDGHGTALLFNDFYGAGQPALAESSEGSGQAERDDLWQAAMELSHLNFRNGPTLPFLDVHFVDPRNGILVGAFGLIALTEDGGAHWTPYLHRLDNPMGLSLNAVTHTGRRWVAAGERGHVFVQDPDNGRFITVDTGYEGSFFRIVSSPGHLLVAGMRGSAYVSVDEGMSWSRLALPTESSINAAAVLSDGRILLADDAGQVLIGRADTGFARMTTLPNERITGLLPLETGQVLVTTLSGLLYIDLQKP